MRGTWRESCAGAARDAYTAAAPLHPRKPQAPGLVPLPLALQTQAVPLSKLSAWLSRTLAGSTLHIASSALAPHHPEAKKQQYYVVLIVLSHLILYFYMHMYFYCHADVIPSICVSSMTMRGDFASTSTKVDT
jgi:hypothetical protein